MSETTNTGGNHPIADCFETDVIKHLRSQLDVAKAVIAKLPKTADGVPVIVHEHPVVFVFTKRKGLYRPGEKADWWEMVVDMFDGERFSGVVAGSHKAAFRSEYCYSTYKAATVATAAEENP